MFDAERPPRRPAGCVVHAVGPTSDWGATQRNLGMKVATGSHLAFMDDDDVYVRGAGAVIRRAIEADPTHVHVFSMRNRDQVVSGPVASGFISTQMFVVPREPVAAWPSTTGGGEDHMFISETLRLRGDEPVFHPDIIARIRPPTFRRVLHATVSPTIQRNVAGRTWRRLRRATSRRPHGTAP